MNRTLLALALALIATGAFAAEAETVEAPVSGCPKAEQAQDKTPPAQTSQATTHPGTPAPVRPRTTSGKSGAPRWHSLLPGMFR